MFLNSRNLSISKALGSTKFSHLPMHLAPKRKKGMNWVGWSKFKIFKNWSYTRSCKKFVELKCNIFYLLRAMQFNNIIY